MSMEAFGWCWHHLRCSSIDIEASSSLDSMCFVLIERSSWKIKCRSSRMRGRTAYKGPLGQGNSDHSEFKGIDKMIKCSQIPPRVSNFRPLEDSSQCASWHPFTCSCSDPFFLEGGRRARARIRDDLQDPGKSWQSFAGFISTSGRPWTARRSLQL